MNIFVSFLLTGGDDGIRTHDPLLAGQVLSQLSYTPILNSKFRIRNSKLLGFAFSPFCAFALVGPSGLEPPTSCLSGTRSNLLSYDPMWLVWVLHTRFFQSREQISLLSLCVGIELFSRAASSKVFSPLQSLTSVFGMGTGGPSAFVTPTFLSNSSSLNIEQLYSQEPFFVLLKSFELTR